MASVLPLLGLAPMGWAGAAWAQATGPVALAFTGATVIDVRDGRRRTAQTVLIIGRHIRAVGATGKVRVPADAHIVDARGKYLIPGLWDMHVHIDDSVSLYPRYIAYGVTGVREMAQRGAGRTDSFRLWQRQVMAGTRVGPRSIGPSADFEDTNYASVDTNPQSPTQGLVAYRFKSPEDLQRIVDSMKAAGNAFVKIHAKNSDDRGLYFAMARAARRAGLPHVGHVPVSTRDDEAADSGQLSIEHVDQYQPCGTGNFARWDSVSAERVCAPVARALVRNGTWLVPTFYIARGDRVKNAAMWRFVRTMRRLGFRRFLTGSDTWHGGVPTLVETMFLAEAGLPPLEALQAATLHPAEYLHATDSLGTVAAGKLADLVLLDADPLQDLRNVTRIRAVVANGRYFDRVALDALDPTGPKAALAARYFGDSARAGRKGYPMFLFGQVTRTEAAAHGVPWQPGMALVWGVEPRSCAEAAGLQAGDLILTMDGKPPLAGAVDPDPVHGDTAIPYGKRLLQFDMRNMRSITQFMQDSEKRPVGEVIRLEIARKGGVRRALTVTVEDAELRNLLPVPECSSGWRLPIAGE